MLKDPKWDVAADAPWRVVLLEAADLIDERGHAKGVMEDQKGGLCIQGALSLAIFGTPTPSAGQYMDGDNGLIHEASQRLFSFRSRTGHASRGYDSHSCAWNNAPERTKEEVVSVLRAAAREEGV